MKFLWFTLGCIVIQAIIALFEMACISFNKVRLQYYVSLGSKPALWLQHLLQKPSRLFGTTLIGITAALQFGSECARRFYESMGLDPDWAPLSLVAVVLIFGELTPMFAGRRHPEQVAITLSPYMIFLSKLLSPVIWCFEMLSRILPGGKKETSDFLSREEIKFAFEAKEKEDRFNIAANQIFRLRTLTAGQIMVPLISISVIPSTTTLADLRKLLSVKKMSIVPIYHQALHNIVAVAHLRDLLRLGEKKKVLDGAKSPWFVTQDTSVLTILEQFCNNNQSIAVILDAKGIACGILTLDQILAYIFGEERASSEETGPSLYVERTLSGSMTIQEFEAEFHEKLSNDPEETLSDWLLDALGHAPSKGETLVSGDFEITVLEPSLRGAKTLSVRSKEE